MTAPPVVTSPPYFNAPFDYPDLFERCIFREDERSRKGVKNVAEGRIVCIVCDNILVKGKSPVVA